MATAHAGLKTFSLFTGIGGFEVGLRRAGHHIHWMSEIDPAASAVLKAHFSNTDNCGDVRTIKSLPSDAELLVGGFPCQDLSLAGATAGINGENSSLVREVFRLLRKTRVPWVLLENVPFMLQLRHGEAIKHIIEELECLGYSWAYRVIDSQSFGLPQRRERVFLLASINYNPALLLFQEDAGPPPAPPSGPTAVGFYWTEGFRGLGWAVDSVPTLKGGSGLGIPSPPAIWLPDGRIVTPDIRDAERLQGFPPNWTLPAQQLKRAGYRWKLVGNAVSVPTAEWLGQLLLKAPSSSLLHPPQTLSSRSSWPKAAWGSRRHRYAAPVSSWPKRVQRKPLHMFLQYEPKLLSRRATLGFMGRLSMSRLRFPDAFWKALEAHLQRMGGVFEAPSSVWQSENLFDTYSDHVEIPTLSTSPSGSD